MGLPNALRWVETTRTLLPRAFAATLAFTFAPILAAHLTSFDVGERLVWKHTDKPLGEVLQYDSQHAFEEGATAPAYEIQLSTDVARWLPASELHRNCAAR